MSLLPSLSFEPNRGTLKLSPLAFGLTLFSLLIPIIVLVAWELQQRRYEAISPAGCRKLGLHMRSNLADQYSPKYSTRSEQGTAKDGSPTWRVKALFIYPIKSCCGVELGRGDIIRTGMKYDRQFSFAQEVTSLPSLEEQADGSHSVNSEWNSITQRTFPRLAKVETEIWVPDPTSPTFSPNAEFVKSEGCVVVRFPFSPDVDFSWEGLRAFVTILAAKISRRTEPTIQFCIPFNPTLERIIQKEYRSEKMKIWTDMPEALNMGVEIPDDTKAKLKYCLGVSNPLTLFRIDTRKYREVFKCAPKKKEVGFQPIIGMADSYPLHIVNLASVRDVASRLPKGYRKEFNALRYRANIYITGPPAFSEDAWAKIRIGKCTCHISCRTTRCKLPNVDPATGIRDRNEPETTMRKYRVIDGGSIKPCLGMQVTPLVKEQGEIKVGDEVEVLAHGEHFFLKI